MTPPSDSTEIAITLPRATWLDMARRLLVCGGTPEAALLMRACRPGCRNGHGPEERFVRPSGALRCHACQVAAGARQRLKGKTRG